MLLQAWQACILQRKLVEANYPLLPSCSTSQALQLPLQISMRGITGSTYIRVKKVRNQQNISVGLYSGPKEQQSTKSETIRTTSNGIFNIPKAIDIAMSSMFFKVTSQSISIDKMKAQQGSVADTFSSSLCCRHKRRLNP